MSEELCTKKCIFHADAHEGYCDRLEKLEDSILGTTGIIVQLSTLVESFKTVRLVVYGGVALTLSTVFGALLMLVIRSAK